MAEQKKKNRITRENTSQKRNIVFIPSNSALLVIDMQEYFCNPCSHAYFKEAVKILPTIKQLLIAYRTQSLPIIFTRYALRRSESPGAMGRWWRDVLYDDNEMSSLINALRPQPQEPVIRKTQYSAFFKTNLDRILKEKKVTTVVVTGVLTHLCCETTARDAFMHNYDVFFVVDATASDEKRLHSASLATLSDGFATLTTANEVCTWIKETT
ncbi:MAG: cysteine hydrolase [Candidatus Thermoplasmatota archaeon]|nr:cysteine hydrolase [Candidatus Thermoplasmatota archaeon]